MMIPRNKKQVIFTSHFFRQAVIRSLFPDDCMDTMPFINAVKESGVLHPDKEKDMWFCIFKDKMERFITLSIIEKEDCFIVKTVWESNEWEKKTYIGSKNKLKLDGDKDVK